VLLVRGEARVDGEQRLHVGGPAELIARAAVPDGRLELRPQGNGLALPQRASAALPAGSWTAVELTPFADLRGRRGQRELLGRLQLTASPPTAVELRVAAAASRP
jgi:hypothetical protein